MHGESVPLPPFGARFPLTPPIPFLSLTICLCAARHQVSHLLEGVDPYVYIGSFPRSLGMRPSASDLGDRFSAR
jgi:hypothetical protein